MPPLDILMSKIMINIISPQHKLLYNNNLEKTTYNRLTSTQIYFILAKENDVSVFRGNYIIV